MNTIYYSWEIVTWCSRKPYSYSSSTQQSFKFYSIWIQVKSRGPFSPRSGSSQAKNMNQQPRFEKSPLIGSLLLVQMNVIDLMRVTSQTEGRPHSEAKEDHPLVMYARCAYTCTHSAHTRIRTSDLSLASERGRSSLCDVICIRSIGTHQLSSESEIHCNDLPETERLYEPSVYMASLNKGHSGKQCDTHGDRWRGCTAEEDEIDNKSEKSKGNYNKDHTANQPDKRWGHEI